MITEHQASTRLYVLLAREAPVAVVFRRGPSKQVLLLKWYTDRDVFEEGQWLKVMSCPPGSNFDRRRRVCRSRIMLRAQHACKEMGGN